MNTNKNTNDNVNYWKDAINLANDYRSNANSGYEGYSRSKRSQEAIDHYCVPISMIDRDMISNFENGCSKQYPPKIFKLAVNRWTFVANRVGPESYHHTGKYFKVTEHYSLYDIADYLTNHINTIDIEYKVHKKQPVKLALITSGFWKKCSKSNYSRGYKRTKKYWKIVKEEKVYGYLKNSKLIAYNGYYGAYDLYAKKVTDVQKVGNVHDLAMLLDNNNMTFDEDGFIHTLDDAKLNYHMKPNPNDADEMKQSHQLEQTNNAIVNQRKVDEAERVKQEKQYAKKVRLSMIRAQRVENKKNPTALNLRKIVSKKDYKEFKRVLFANNPSLKQQGYVPYNYVYRNVYGADLFHMPKHLVTWLHEQEDDFIYQHNYPIVTSAINFYLTNHDHINNMHNVINKYRRYQREYNKANKDVSLVGLYKYKNTNELIQKVFPDLCDRYMKH